MPLTPLELPTLLLTGFLGAGKTTLLNRLLAAAQRRGERWMVILNEFGDLGVDAGLLAPGAEEVQEVNSGSIFCVCTRDRLLSALDRALAAEPALDRLVIEATGIAATSDLGPLLSGSRAAGRLRVEANACLIDAVSFHKIRKTLPAARDQVTEASLLIVNKVDLVDEGWLAQLESDLRGLNAVAPILRCSFGDIDPAALLDAGRGGVGWASTLPPASAAPIFIQQVTLEAAGPVDRAAFDAFLEELPADLLRGKGTLDFGHVVEYVERDLSGWRRRPLPERPPGPSHLVLIGRRLSPDAIRAAWSRCVARDSDS